jgi:hypothetical protein
MKERHETLDGIETITYYAPSGVVTNVISLNTVRFKSDVHIATNVVNGDFRAPNAYGYSVREFLYGKGTVTELYNGNISQIESGDLTSGNFDPDSAIAEQVPDDESRNYNRALNKLNDKARGNLDLSTSAIEYHQTQKMLGSAGKISSYLGNTIRDFERRWSRLTPLERGRIISRRQHLVRNQSDELYELLRTVPIRQLMKDLGGNWLQFHLGLRPLLSDFQDSVKEAYTGVIPSMLRIKSKVYSPIVVKSISSSRPHYRVIRPDITGVQGVEFHVQFRPPDQVNLTRLTSLSPLSWAWELLTLSFVIDYVYNVGNMLRDAETAILYDRTFESGYVTFLKAYSGTTTALGGYRFNSAYSYDCKFTAQTKVIDFRRQVLASWPIPRLPVFELKLGSIQLLTIASLLAQKLGRR